MPKITPIPAYRLRKVFENVGFKCVRIEGDHFIYTKTGIQRPVVIPNWKEVPVFIIKNNLRSAGLSRNDYFEILETL
ncbi:type II toxin-antitoxin system HicA family toxin [bacterium]|nr:type II toxin-antitoxin system HicA family toxin [bacterium]